MVVSVFQYLVLLSHSTGDQSSWVSLSVEASHRGRKKDLGVKKIGVFVTCHYFGARYNVEILPRYMLCSTFNF
ncbi:hypothetical protein RSOLAG1IB_06535 [Rhizoctonia solani AG-1 IB]|uniref:Uncharacterized protein n=1 Tax=Thanatephorus cucumeris (strain AG1-IB / isolate 7/3/14) TaxID=1108050 RepID=A0A0B7F810_THACB|nr:hypothetical protein RSOLAG1IB_06535 [Rhizoctonia solani AG-1 IB]